MAAWSLFLTFFNSCPLADIPEPRSVHLNPLLDTVYSRRPTAQRRAHRHRPSSTRLRASTHRCEERIENARFLYLLSLLSLSVAVPARSRILISPFALTKSNSSRAIHHMASTRCVKAGRWKLRAPPCLLFLIFFSFFFFFCSLPCSCLLSHSMTSILQRLAAAGLPPTRAVSGT